MRAVTVSDYGAAPAITELPTPEPGPGQMLLRVRAAGMNPMDGALAEGVWAAMMPATFAMVLGADVEGVVESLSLRRRGDSPSARRSSGSC